MKILVTGVAGQLGYDVVKSAQAAGIEAVGIDRSELDLTDEKAVKEYFENKIFDVIVHCAAYTAVDAAEDNVEAAEAINVHATEYLVAAARKMQAKFVYISTDYVFEGIGSVPYTEDMPTKPTSVYGVTKLAGEKIALAYEKTFVVRIAWVFGINGNNFIKTMLKLAETNDKLTVVEDQIGSPTYTVDLAKLIIDMIKTEQYGVYHASNEGYCSWYDFAKEIFTQSNIAIEVKPVDSEAFPTKAKRPLNSRLNKDKLVENGFAKLPAWQDALKRYLVELNK